MKKPENKKTIGLIIACVFLASTFGAMAYIQATDDSHLVDVKSLCHKKSPLAGHIVVVVDKTDHLTDGQIQFIRQVIDGIKDHLNPNELLSIGLITADMDRYTTLTPIFSKCSPGSGDQASFLNKNPRRLQTRFDQQFAEPLRVSLDRLKKEEEYPTSPILETIQAISELPGFTDATVPTRFIIISDMLHNTVQFSQYSQKTFTFDVFKKTEYYRSLQTRFGNTTGEIIYLVNPQSEVYQTHAHQKFWKDLLVDMGVRDVKIAVQRRF